MMAEDKEEESENEIGMDSNNKADVSSNNSSQNLI